jgi:predicted ATPase
VLDFLSLTNFKSFKELELEIRPITVLIGVNGAGKTSILRFLRMIQQTIEERHTDSVSPLRLNGSLTQLGEAKKVLPGFEGDKEWSFEIGLTKGRFRNVLNESFDLISSGFRQSIDRLAFYLERTARRDPDIQGSIRHVYDEFKRFDESTKRGKERGFSELSKLTEQYVALQNTYKSLNRSTKERELSDDELSLSDFRWLNMRGGPRSVRRLLSADSISVGDADTVKTVAQKLALIESDEFSLEYSFRLNKDGKGFDVSKIEIKSGTKVAIGVVVNGSTISKITSDFIAEETLSKHKSSLSNVIDQRKSVFEVISSKTNGSITSLFVLSLLENAAEHVQKSITQTQISHIGPIRHLFDRYIVSTYKPSSLPTLDALELSTALSKDDIRKSADKWFNEFQIRFEVNEITELLRELVAVQTDSGLQLSISDVGFGYSQVLPVIVECFRLKPDSLCMIEQPEVHLHPKMQAKLADFFIDMSGAGKKRGSVQRRFLIETHSENLLKRLRRRIAEGVIAAEDVSINYVERGSEAGCSVLRRVSISNDGHIDWPKAFYITDLDDTRAFVKSMVRKKGNAFSEGE